MSTPSVTSDHLTTKHFSTVGMSKQKPLSNNKKIEFHVPDDDVSQIL